jgi:hypothetical protein
VSERIAGDPARLEDYTLTTRPTIQPAIDASESYSNALLAYQQAPNDLPGRCYADLGLTIGDELTRLAGLDELPAAFAAALRALDARPGPDGALEVTGGDGFDAAVQAALDDPLADPATLRAAADDADGNPLWRVLFDAYDHPTGAYGSVLNLVNLGVWGRANARLEHVSRMANISHRDLLWTGNNRAVRRAQARNLRRSYGRQLPGARSAFDAADEALRTGRGPHTRWLDGLNQRSPGTMRVARVAGRGLGVAGVGLQAADAYNDIQDGEYVDAGFAIAGGGGALVLMAATGPVGIGVGSALVVGSLAWEYRDEIGDLATGAADWVSDTAGSIGSGIADGIGSAASGAADFFGL